jgi:hypothetical protein
MAAEPKIILDSSVIFNFHDMNMFFENPQKNTERQFVFFFLMVLCFGKNYD